MLAATHKLTYAKLIHTVLCMQMEIGFISIFCENCIVVNNNDNYPNCIFGLLLFIIDIFDIHL